MRIGFWKSAAGRKPSTAAAFSGKTSSATGRTPRPKAIVSAVVVMATLYSQPFGLQDVNLSQTRRDRTAQALSAQRREQLQRDFHRVNSRGLAGTGEFRRMQRAGSTPD